MDAENKLKKINEQNRIRQQNYYKNHKDEINVKRRNIYNLGKAKLNPQEEEQDVEPLGVLRTLGAELPKKKYTKQIFQIPIVFHLMKLLML